MTKTVTATGLVVFEYHGQKWFETPGYTEIVFKRLHIEHSYGQETFTNIKDIGSTGRDGRRVNAKHGEDS